MTTQRARLLLFGTSGEILDEFDVNDGHTLIGRTQQAHAIIRDDKASRIHARITYDNNKFYLCDLNSTNGTLLNGQRIKVNTPMELCSNDTIEVGNTRLMFQVVPASIAPIKSQNKPSIKQHNLSVNAVKEAPSALPTEDIHSLSGAYKACVQNLYQDKQEAKQKLLRSIKEKLQSQTTHNHLKEVSLVPALSTAHLSNDVDQLYNEQEYLQETSSLEYQTDPLGHLFESYTSDYTNVSSLSEQIQKEMYNNAGFDTDTQDQTELPPIDFMGKQTTTAQETQTSRASFSALSDLIEEEITPSAKSSIKLMTKNKAVMVGIALFGVSVTAILYYYCSGILG